MKNILLVLVLCFSLGIYGKTQQKFESCYYFEIPITAYIMPIGINLDNTTVLLSLKKKAKKQNLCQIYPELVHFEYTPQCRSPG